MQHLQPYTTRIAIRIKVTYPLTRWLAKDVETLYVGVMYKRWLVLLFKVYKESNHVIFVLTRDVIIIYNVIWTNALRITNANHLAKMYSLDNLVYNVALDREQYKLNVMDT